MFEKYSITLNLFISLIMYKQKPGYIYPGSNINLYRLYIKTKKKKKIFFFSYQLINYILKIVKT